MWFPRAGEVIVSVPAASSPSAVPSGAPAPEDAVRQIFRYLAEVGESRTKPVRRTR
ncbi:hypothetical protein OHB54_12595 [Streptomyces sp. NBC_01007]|nr:hypothetical protein OHB54_12595 [Streptomyces sp. NBC_01007]